MEWMRNVSFVGLRNLLAVAAEVPGGLSRAEIEELVSRDPALATRRGTAPGKGTAGRCCRVLLHLGIFVRQGRRYRVNLGDSRVRELLGALQPDTAGLSPEERRLFSELVLANPDCRSAFFGLFVPESEASGLEGFLASGQRVAWRALSSGRRRSILLSNLDDGRQWQLEKKTEIRAVLYGLRLWARDRLGFLDEIFLEDLGRVMFPVKPPELIPDPRVLSAMAEALAGATTDWVVLPVREIALQWGTRFRLPVAAVYGSLSAVMKAYREYVVPIATSVAFATVTARTPAAEAYQLRSYFWMDGRCISHIRLHRRLGRLLARAGESLAKGG